MDRFELNVKSTIAPCTEEDYHSVRSDKAKAVLKIQHRLMSAIRSFLERQGFLEAAPVIISSATDPGIREAKAASIDFYGRNYKLTTSMILHKQMLISALDKIFVFSPCVRLERHQTNRHLAEFVQIDAEIAHGSRDEVMTIAEQLLASVVEAVKRSSASELATLDRDIRPPKTPFKRISLQEAIERARELGCETPDDCELSLEAETVLSANFESPFWIVDYPVDSRGFYYRASSTDPDTLIDFDLMFPEGFGEGISGGEREYRYEVVLDKMTQRGLPLEDYRWYLNMLREGIPSSAGFGLGLQRLTRYVCGLDDISETTPFPRVPVTED
jgi:asparaginyl-tRNA synthetase